MERIGIKSFLVYGIAFCLVGTIIVSSTEQKGERELFLGNTLYVGGNGPGNYTTIHDALNDAQDGDTIFVYDESAPYYEHLAIYKSVSLIGEERNTTIIDGSATGTVITIRKDNCTISGFTIRNCGSALNEFDRAVIRIYSNNAIITNNIISIMHIEYSDTVAAIEIKDSSYTLITNNILTEEKNDGPRIGIYMKENSSHNMVFQNSISKYSEGIYYSRGISNSDNTISNNTIMYNTFGIEIYGDRGLFTNNTIVYNEVDGINLNGIENILSYNNISYNGGGEGEEGIYFGTLSRRNLLIHNQISNNNAVGVYLLLSYDNRFVENNFIENGKEVECKEKGNAYVALNRYELQLFSNKWQRNYWSDYQGFGFLPHVIPAFIEIAWSYGLPWFNLDWHPAQEPYDIPGMN